MLISPKFMWASCLAAFSLTLFLVLYTSTQNMSIQFQLSPKQQQQQVPLPGMNRDPEEKFMTFLPHSGLHNQRIELVNAAVLAKALNRTLILPQINIGKGIYWHEGSLSELRFNHCPNNYRTMEHCSDFKRYVPVSVESIFDLTALRAAGIRIIQRNDMTTDYFPDVWGVPSDDASQIYRLKDDTRHSYRIYDSYENQDSIRTFQYRVDMEDLKKLDEKIVMFGSLHYTLRLAIQDSYLKWLLEYLREEFCISHPIVTEQALKVVSLLGGPEEFIGIHLRQGDGYFVDMIQETLDTLRSTLQTADFNTHDQTSSSEMVDDASEERYLQEITNSETVRDRLYTCQNIQLNVQRSHRLRLIYMATDTPQPRESLQNLYQEFPCLFSLSDFPEILDEALTMQPMLTGNDQVDAEMGYYGLQIAPLLIPMIDAEITSHGSHFIGTRKSTFSQYINLRHNRFQSMYHPKTIA
jgi:hypothetical protein